MRTSFQSFAGVLIRTACFLLLTATLLSPVTAKAETIRLAADVWCPFNCKADSEHPGFMVEIARTVFEAQGHEVEYIVMPWKRALNEARQHRIDGVIGALSEDAPDFIFPENETGVSMHGFFTLESSWMYTGPESAKGYVFGAARGYSYGRELDELIASGILDADMIGGHAPLISNLQKLNARRIDVIIAERSVLVKEAERLGLGDRIRYAGSPDSGNNVYIAFAPDLPQSVKYAEMLSRGMTELRRSGRLNAILAKYNLKDWK